MPNIYDRQAREADRLMDDVSACADDPTVTGRYILQKLDQLASIANDFESFASEIDTFVEDVENSLMDEGRI
jgi:hypothetical protein